MSRISSFFGFTDADQRLYTLVRKLVVLMLLMAGATQLTTTFFMVSIAEAMGGGSIITGMTMVSLLVVVQLVIQTVLDYPSGVIGDWVGQRYIIASGFLCFAAAMFIVSIANASSPFWMFIAIYALNGIGSSQMSGAFQAWFDSNYRVAAPYDKERRQYGVFWGKVNVLFQVIGVLVLIPGSMLASIFTRPWVFRLESILYVIIALLALRAIQDLPEVARNRSGGRSLAEYRGLLGGGISYIKSSRFVAFIIAGQTILMSTGIIWGELYLFPMYHSYLRNDVAVSTFRTILFIIGVFQSQRAAVWSGKLNAEAWLTRSTVLMGTGFIFYLSFASIMFLLPPTAAGEVVSLVIPFTSFVFMQIPTSSLLPILLIAATFTATGLFGALVGILAQRVLLDVIPDKIRNSVYSLTPAVATTMAIPQIAFIGWLLPIAGFPLAMALSGMISLFGTLMVRKGLSYPRPTEALEPEPSAAVAGAALTE